MHRFPVPFVACAILVALAGCETRPPRHGWHPGPDRPARAAARFGLFLSPMGEPFRGAGGREAQVRRWFDGADANHDGVLTRAEFRADAARFFATLDRNRDGEIGPEEVAYYETEIAPEIRVGGYGGRMGRPGGGHRGGHGGHRGGGGGPGPAAGNASPGEAPLQGAARFGFFPYPEPVTAADADLNRGITLAEFLAAADQRFLALDSAHDGALRFETLPPLPGPAFHRR